MSYLLSGLFQGLIVNTKENTLMIHAVPTRTYPVYIYANQIGFGLQLFGA